MHERGIIQGNTPPLMLFATPPPLEQLRGLTVHIPSTVQTVSRFQPQVIKCREFIFTEPEVIGTPSADINDHSFHLITNVSGPFSVSTELYQACLQYTITARLSPAWNKAGPWLIRGRDFLTQKGCSNAVRMDLTVVNNELYFTLEATALKQGPLQVTDLDILGRQLERYLTHSDVTIEHEHIASDWCYILPSMKRGRIWSISHDLPEESPFNSYKDLKRHWKNTYGYRLPESEEGLHFYQINFGPFGGKLFTYPEVCLRPREMQRISRIDPKPILRSFILEIQNKFPTVCGQSIKLQSKAKFTVNELLSINQVEAELYANLSNKMKNSRPAVYRSQTEMNQLLASQSSQLPITAQVPTPQNPKPLIQRPSLTTGLSETIKNTTTKTPNKILHEFQNSTPVAKGAEISLSFENVSSQLPGTQQSGTARRLFPSFKPKKPAVLAQPVANSQPAPRVVPLFSSYKTSAQTHVSELSSEIGQIQQFGSMPHFNCSGSKSLARTDKMLPLFHKQSKPVPTAPMTKSATAASKPKSNIVSKEAGTSKGKLISKRKKDGKKLDSAESKKIKRVKPED